MDKKELKNIKSYGFIMGYILATVCSLCITACISMGVITAAVKFILWLFRM